MREKEDKNARLMTCKAMSESEREAYRNALLAYCKLDTLAMLKVLEKLREAVGND